MAKATKKNTPVSKPKAAVAVKTAPKTVLPMLQTPAFLRDVRKVSLAVFAFAFLLYANTLGHGFVLDDDIVIKRNVFTQQGFSGIGGILGNDTFYGYFQEKGKETLVTGGRYRPLTLVLFAMVYQVFKDNAFMYHLLTVLLFAATCMLLYRTLYLLLRQKSEEYAALTAAIAAFLFTAHPIHTEVVANIKGCDEIVTLLGSLGAMWLTIKAFDTGKSRLALLAGAVFFLACLSKENAAAFFVAIPLALWFFRSADFGKVIQYSLPAWVAFAVFFLLRGAILEWRFGGEPMELMNNPFLKIVGNEWVKFSAAERLATIFYTLGKYVLLLVFPHPLTHDYYPRQIGIIQFSHPMALFGLALYSFLSWYLISGLRQKDPVRFGIAVYLLALSIVSNFVFPIGTNMGERFAFMPSVGFCLAAAALIVSVWGKIGVNGGLAIVGLVCVLFAAKTILRNPAWASNEKIFFTDLAVSSNSAKIRNACGGTLLDKATAEKDPALQKKYCEEALPHLNKALEIYPNYKDAYISRGGCYYLLKQYEKAIADYRVAGQLSKNDKKTTDLLVMALRDGGMFAGEKEKNFTKAMKYLTEAWQLNQKDPTIARLIGVAYAYQNKNAEALPWFQKASDMAPDNASFLFDLGTANAMIGNIQKGEELRQKARQMDPKLGK